VTPAYQAWLIALRRTMCGSGKANFIGLLSSQPG
jgi:hypothetical protein